MPSLFLGTPQLSSKKKIINSSGTAALESVIELEIVLTNINDDWITEQRVIFIFKYLQEHQWIIKKL